MAGACKNLSPKIPRRAKASVPFDANNMHAPASNTAAVVTVSGVTGIPIQVGQVFWSYSAAPTGGSIKIEDGSSNVVWGPFAITSAGIGSITFDPPLQGTVGTDLILTLAAGGTGISGVVGITPSGERGAA